MCGGFTYADVADQQQHAAAQGTALAQAAIAKLNAHKGVSCDEIACVMLTLEDASVLSLQRLPIKSPHQNVMYMLPVPHECLGPNSEYLIASGNMPCVYSCIDAILDPAPHVEVPEIADTPRYRSLSASGDEGDSGNVSAPPIRLPPAHCVENTDGSKTFVLHTHTIVKSEQDMHSAIAAGQYKDVPDYHQATGYACFDSLVEGLKRNHVPLYHLFAHDDACVIDPDPDGPFVVHPIAMLNFLDELLPLLMPGHDMLVCVPKFDDKGVPAPRSAFTFAFHYPAAVATRPLLGLVHNDPTISTNPRVDENYAIVSNVTMPISVDPAIPSGVPTQLPLHPTSAFLPKYAELDEVHPHHGSRVGGVTPYEVVDGWLSGCEKLQQMAMQKLWADVAAFVVDELKLPPFDASTIALTNLVGMHLPATTTAVRCEPELTTASAINVKKRMRTVKRERVVRAARHDVAPEAMETVV